MLKILQLLSFLPGSSYELVEKIDSIHMRTSFPDLYPGSTGCLRNFCFLISHLPLPVYLYTFLSSDGMHFHLLAEAVHVAHVKKHP